MSSGDIAIRLFMGLIAHGMGDYVLQSNWMALEKTRRWVVAAAHGALYTVPFVFLVAVNSVVVWLVALALIGGTHAVLDRYRVARFVIYGKNLIAPPSQIRPWSECRETGFPPEAPEYLARWLLIIVDNLIHILINTLVIIWAVKA